MFVQVGETTLKASDAVIGEARSLADTKPDVARRLAAALEAWDKELAAPVFLGSSVKNEDWGPGGANQKNRSRKNPKQGGSAGAGDNAGPEPAAAGARAAATVAR